MLNSIALVAGMGTLGFCVPKNLSALTARVAFLGHVLGEVQEQDYQRGYRGRR
jgi:hypothetical protein